MFSAARHSILTSDSRYAPSIKTRTSSRRDVSSTVTGASEGTFTGRARASSKPSDAELAAITARAVLLAKPLTWWMRPCAGLAVVRTGAEADRGAHLLAYTGGCIFLPRHLPPP